jgi:hypothetical protein
LRNAWLDPTLSRQPLEHRNDHENLHVRGYKEKGNINTPLEISIVNQVDRFNPVIDTIDRLPRMRDKAAHLQDEMETPSSTTFTTPTLTARLTRDRRLDVARVGASTTAEMASAARCGRKG